ncbi:unnamed protein product [Orchesella dallaii]|uniref:Uncharacterized protein n=1 Tax=Orchesella dallaii TaxID=48710 RepID=A0ABP1Q3I3_9HEXA
MRHKRTTASTVYRPNRFTGPGGNKLRGKRWKDVLAAAAKFEAQQERENKKRLELNQTGNVNAAQASELNRMESTDAEGRSQVTQSESAIVTNQIEQENVRGDAEAQTCPINIQDSGRDSSSNSEVQFLGEVGVQAGEEKRLNILDWNRIDDFQRFLDSLPPLPAGVQKDFPLENLEEPVAHCSTTLSPLSNIKLRTSAFSVISNDAAPSQVNRMKAGEKSNEELGNENTLLKSWVSELVSQEVGKLTQEMSKLTQGMGKLMQKLSKQGQEMQATLKADQKIFLRSLKHIKERQDGLNKVRDRQDTVAQVLRTEIQSRQEDGSEIRDRMEGSNQNCSNGQRHRTPAISLPSFQLPKQQSQFKRRVPAQNTMKFKNFPPKRMTKLGPPLITKKTESITVGGTTSTPLPAILASAIPPPTMSLSSYRSLRNRRVKKAVYVPLPRIDKQPVLHDKKSVGK